MFSHLFWKGVAMRLLSFLLFIFIFTQSAFGNEYTCSDQENLRQILRELQKTCGDDDHHHPRPGYEDMKVCIDYARSYYGLNLSSDESIKLCQSVRKLDDFKNCYSHATSYYGLNMSKNEAIELCKEMRHFDTFKPCMEHATSYYGLNLNRPEAIGLCKEIRSLEEFKKCYEHAVSYYGLNLSKERALEMCRRY